MDTQDDEEARLRSVALQNSQFIHLARFRAEEALRKHSDWMRVTLASIGDAVITTDADGRVTFVNGVAEALTGWRQAEALGHPLSEVFRIVNEPSREPVENPAIRALREGKIVGLANHTILIAKNGTERPIDDSAAPIRDEEGRLVGCVLVFRDVAERRRTQRALERSERDLRDFFDNASVGLHSVGPDGIILRVNRTELDLLGYRHEEYVGHHIAEFHVDQPVIQEILARLARAETLREYPARMRCKDGSIRDVLINSNGLFEDGEFIHTRCFTLDVTARKLAETEREELLQSERAARAEAERAGRLKEEFLATLSHELRTPLQAILGWTSLLLNQPQSQETRDQGLAVIDRNARMQAQLIADLLDMSRIISGKMRLEVQRVELPVVMAAALESIRPAADAKELTIQKVLEPIPEPIYGDPARLQQIFWNLLSNAVKFTPRDGRIQVVVARVNSNVEISVSDTGKGIKREFLPHVFERFRQGEGSVAREYGGLGLGLAIVKQLVELHGGNVRVASDGEGRGATFSVLLPLAIIHTTSREDPKAHPKALLHTPVRYDPPNLAGVRVLVVDDEPDARDLLKRLLEACHAQVVLAKSADEALAVVEREHPDVILSDIGMPDRDGYSFMKAVRAQGIRIPAAALTAFARSEDRTRAYQAGYQMHVAKPVETAELLATVASLARMNIATGEGKRPPRS